MYYCSHTINGWELQNFDEIVTRGVKKLAPRPEAGGGVPKGIKKIYYFT
jgi:hypothetical protein